MKTILVLCACVCACYANTLSIAQTLGPDTLELLHVIFRHGDRTPESGYPNDPYKDVTYYPVGYGELTNAGKVTAYNIGISLKKNYGRFIGDVYTPSLIDPLSSYYSRCKASLELVLAALFPPTNIQQWNANLPWQPIPYMYTPANLDTIFWSMNNCPNYQVYSAQSQADYESSRDFANNIDLINYLLENSGYNLTGWLAIQLYSTLKCQLEWGYALPEWAESVYPEPLRSLSAKGWEVFVEPKNQSTVLGGFIMSKIVDDTYGKINSTASEKDRKIHFYSGHDLTVASVLSWLGVFYPHNPPYGATVTIEVHKLSTGRALVIYYEDYSGTTPHLIWIPGCGPVCPLDTFVELYRPYFDATALCG